MRFDDLCVKLSLCIVALFLFSPRPSAKGQADSSQAKSLQTLTVAEHFGVDHPRQIIDFDIESELPPSAPVYVVDGEGREVAFQILRDGKLAIDTDLPANATR